MGRGIFTLLTVFLCSGVHAQEPWHAGGEGTILVVPRQRPVEGEKRFRRLELPELCKKGSVLPERLRAECEWWFFEMEDRREAIYRIETDSLPQARETLEECLRRQPRFALESRETFLQRAHGLCRGEREAIAEREGRVEKLDRERLQAMSNLNALRIQVRLVNSVEDLAPIALGK